MKIDSCPKCNKKGSLIFTTTKNNGRKYGYVKHYDSAKKSTRKCSVSEKEYVRLKFVGKWYREYDMFITVIQAVCDVFSTSRMKGLVR